MTPLEIIAAAATLIFGGSVVGAYVAVRKLPFDLSRSRADTDSAQATAAATVAQSAQALVAPLKANIESLQKEVAELRCRVMALEEDLEETQRDRDEWRNKSLDAQAECIRLLKRLQESADGKA